MKKCIITLFSICCVAGSCKNKFHSAEPRITVDNDKVRVTEYEGDPTGDVCGHGIHKHGPHLTVLLTDGDLVETKDGKSTKMHVYKGISFWSNGETHSVVNVGSSPFKSIIVEVKNHSLTGQ